MPEAESITPLLYKTRAAQNGKMRPALTHPCGHESRPLLQLPRPRREAFLFWGEIKPYPLVLEPYPFVLGKVTFSLSQMSSAKAERI